MYTASNRILLFLLFPLSFMVACAPTPEGQQVEAQAPVEVPDTVRQPGPTARAFLVNTEESSLYWEGMRIVGNRKHNGTIKIDQGVLFVENGEVTGGNFLIDMTSLSAAGMEADAKQKLETHLKSGDFFEVETYPTAEFTIVSVSRSDGSKQEVTHDVVGNLTMKGITKSVEIEARITLMQDKLQVVTPKFVIDRTQWNVMYDATIIGTAKDEAIADQVVVAINLEAHSGNR